jgi:hypothetical protein
MGEITFFMAKSGENSRSINDCPYRAPVPPGSAFARSNEVTFVKTITYVETATEQESFHPQIASETTPGRSTTTIVHHLHLHPIS